MLLIAFQLKHWACDYPLQTEYMLQKLKKSGWFFPLFAHASTHALGTALIIIAIGKSEYLWLALLDLVMHFVIDRVKALLPWNNPQTRPFWAVLGADQMAHHLSGYLLISLLWSHS